VYEVSRILSLISLRFSAYLCDLCVKKLFNAEVAEIRREPQRREILFLLL